MSSNRYLLPDFFFHFAVIQIANKIAVIQNLVSESVRSFCHLSSLPKFRAKTRNNQAQQIFVIIQIKISLLPHQISLQN